MPAREIALTQDDTFTGSLCLAGVELWVRDYRVNGEVWEGFQ